MMLKLLLTLMTVAGTTVIATCDCGYTVNDTSSGSYAIFTDLFETDFLHLFHIPPSSDSSSPPVGWQPQAYNVTPSAARGPYGKAAEVANVIVNPLKNRWDWGGQGTLGGDPGLQIWVRGRNNLSFADGTDEDQGLLVRMGEIAALRDDMMYASVRFGVKVTHVPGTCSAFFWYRDNTQEIDLEYLSSEAPPLGSNNVSAPLNLVLQSAESAALGYNAATTPGFKLYDLPFISSAGYHELRFDWLPDRIDFYADGAYLYTFTENIPDGPGRLILNHWSNGDPGWSHGPPSTDAVTTISYVKAYFNSTNSSRTAQWDGFCASSWQNQTCSIPEISNGGSIDPTGPNGNVTGKTFFFSLEQDDVVNQTIYAGATAVPGLADRLKPLPGSSAAAWTVVFGLMVGMAILMI